MADNSRLDEGEDQDHPHTTPRRTGIPAVAKDGGAEPKSSAEAGPAPADVEPEQGPSNGGVMSKFKELIS